MVKDMLAQQDELNKYIDGDWRNQNFDWQTAILVEAVELADSTNWKWWKSGEDDLFNARVEATDIWFFLMSHLMTKYNEELIADKATTYFTDLEFDTSNRIPKTKSFIFELLKEETDLEALLISFSYVLESLEMDLEDLYKSYNTKNVLNKFRQDNGYKDGSYIKIWNGLEDNVVAYDFASTIEANENFKDSLQDMLNDFYVSNVKEAKQSTRIINGKRVTK